MKSLLTSIAFVTLMALPAAAQQPEPTLEQVALDGVRTCMSIADGRAPADAASIFGFAAAGPLFARETATGKVEISPPSADRKSCRTQISALTLDNDQMVDAVKSFLTTPPQAYTSYQSRVGESIGGGFASRVSIWVASGGPVLGQVTLYEILADEYYHGPKVMIDFIINRHGPT